MARLLLLGAGHAHLDAIRAIPTLTARGHAVTVVGPGPCHCYSGMGPGVLGGTYPPQAMALPVRRMVEAAGGTFVTDTAVRIDAPEKAVRFASGLRLDYDVCSCNVGSVVARALPGGRGQANDGPDNSEELGGPGEPDGDGGGGPLVLPVKPIENLYRARQALLRQAAHGPVHVVVAGGGPAALEVACNAAVCLGRARGHGAATVPEGDSVTLVAGRTLLPRLPERARLLCRTAAAARGVRIIEGARAVRVAKDGLLLDGGRTLPASVILLATGVAPPPLFAASGLPVGPDGGLAVNAHLQSIDHPDLFGGGDCIHFTPAPLARVGVHAVRQGPVLAANLAARLDGHARRTTGKSRASGQPGLAPYIPRPGYLLVLDTGAGTGVLHRPIPALPGVPALCFSGRLAFLLKRAIDTRFIRRHLPPGGTRSGKCPWDAED
ncbi:FAD-dependent oxidoreductase [Nitratidesulfovibrio sp. HK-II]|uniref:NAD(P)/FAD-dependent oxidoreductase n=1 Tax=Nitratidesulfovibrio sp. HK-II TaxID=2009266 RepID=UPI000E2F28A8|nr:FAD-dependent oxidoreductase [Nitratidesulfovibrio sp. HK-II]GBO97134.1 NADH dehydrogenase-like protein [Nitratidesulfovibrio sp. HK-II]